MDSVEICNLSLMMLGINPITSFDEENDNAKLCKKFFPVCRDRVLRDHLWSFATTSCELQKTDETSFDPHYEFVCALPGDLIRIQNLVGDHAYRRVGNRILTDVFPATLVYTRRVENPDLFDPTFVEALQYLIAAEIGMANTRDAQLINLYRAEYERRLAVARSIDTSENRFAVQNNPPRSTYIGARFAGHGYYRPGKTYWTQGTEGKE